jgi:hypothetical protein
MRVISDVGQLTEKVEVTAASPLVETARASKAGHHRRSIREMA